jgi:hypothetical protein
MSAAAAELGDPAAEDHEVTLCLQLEEAALLQKICRSYRSSLPIYLRSVQSELATLDSLLERLR